MNKAGIWQSSEQWDFQPKNGSIIIENMSKNKALGVHDKDKVILEDFDKDEGGQLWVKAESKTKGFLILKINGSNQVLSAKIESKSKHVM